MSSHSPVLLLGKDLRSKIEQGAGVCLLQEIIYQAVLKPSLVLKRPGQFKTWFQNDQINNLAVLKPHLISKFFYSMCSYMYKMYFFNVDSLNFNHLHFKSVL